MTIIPLGFNHEFDASDFDIHDLTRYAHDMYDMHMMYPYMHGLGFI